MQVCHGSCQADFMNVTVTCDVHFERTPDGRVWTNGPMTYSFWTRYLSVFDALRLVARVRDVLAVPPGQEPASGARITFVPVPDFVGPQQYILRVIGVARALARAVGDRDAVILRSGLLSGWVGRRLSARRRPYGVEVIADPYDVFSPKAIRHPLRPFFRWRSTRILRRQCAGACAAAYVTAAALQRRYPPAPQAFATFYSDVELREGSFVSAPRTSPRRAAVRLIFVGTLAQLYKAPDVLIEAAGACLHEGLSIELVLVGAGRYQRQLESRAATIGLGSRVRFCGQLVTAQAVRAELDQADLFVLPSRQEGLPRAMIEAMARALPCVGSTVGGIPELLPAEDLVPPNDAPALARKIRDVVTDPARMARMSARSLDKAREYAPDVLVRRRELFYHHVRVQTEAWLKTKAI